jgi:hypothetical protein
LNGARANQDKACRKLTELRIGGRHCVSAVGDDTRRDGWGLVIQIKQAVAEHARREASCRIRRGLEGKALKGETAGGRAYGYRPASQSSTGQVEIIEAEAAVVRRIFELYAEGISTRAIANRLNSENLPSPGAAWRRTDTGEHAKRRGKWVGSAIHGDPKRGYAILNNERYLGRLNWGRLQWKRGAVDSKKRTPVVADSALLVSRVDERLRIVSNELWQRVKPRQSAQAIGPFGSKASRLGSPRRRSFRDCFFARIAVPDSWPEISAFINALRDPTVA